MTDVEIKKCNRCKVAMTFDKFKKKKNGSYMKLCIKCNIKCIESKNKCEHNRQKSQCKQCGGGSICEHNREKSKCKECGGGSICEHNRIKSFCKECGGSQICEHNRQKSICKQCNFSSYLSDIVRSRIYKSLKFNKELSSKEYLGCDIETFKIHIEKTFEEGMNWDNYGQWHIDHIIPIKYKEYDNVADLEEVIKRLHYTNTQALWASDNIAKGNRFIGK